MASKRQKTSRANYFKREQAARIDGPGVFVTCVRGKEKQSVSELYDVFESIAADLWPEASEEITQLDEHPPEEEDSVEAEIARELEALKRPRKEKRFANVHTDTPCFLFISTRPPINPVQLVSAYLTEVATTHRARTRYVNRLLPASGVCTANIPEILSLAREVLPRVFEDGNSYRYKIELSLINHSRLQKPDIITPLAELVPKDRGHIVDLKHPERVILVQVFKQWCGLSVVEKWEEWRRWNVMQLAEVRPAEEGEREGEGREKVLEALVEAPELAEEPRPLEESV